MMPWFLSGCLATKYLKEDEKLLYSQTIKAPKGFSKEGLSDLYVKKANSKFLGLPINTLVWMYYKGLKRFDIEELKTKRMQIEIKFDEKISKASSSTKKTNIAYRKQKKLDNVDKKIANGNSFMQWGEPVAVFDTATVLATKNKLNTYLQLNGYFQGATTSKTVEFKRRIGVVYTLTPGAAYHYDTILFSIPDSLVMTLIKDAQSTSFLKNGDRYSQDNLTKERDRLDLTLKDQGYFDFSKQYIDYQVDTSYLVGHKIALLIHIQNPPKRNFHKQFIIDSVAMTTDANTKVPGNIKRQNEAFHNITFSYFKNNYNKRILSQRIFIAKDSLFNRTKTFRSQRQLANLDNFKFVNINYDTTGGKFVANIFASPLDLYSLSNEVGVTVTQGFPGPYINLSLKKRNLFKGLEIGEINGRFGFEGVASATDENAVYASTEASINGSLIFPQFLFPFSQRKFYRYGQYNPRTRVSSGYTYSDRPEYKRGITNISGTYTWDINQRKQFALTAVNLNIIDSKLDSTFEQRLLTLQGQGNNLINAFKKSFVSSMIFAFTWNPNNYGNKERNSHIIRATLESGGTFLNFWTPDILLERKLELYQYVRVSLDFRKNFILDKSRSLAYRINSGVGLPYGSNTVLPYEKNFFAGGSNSVRAWRPRRLGIGSAPPPFSENIAGNGYFDYKYERPGEILIEGSLELRQKLFGFVSSAIFVDVGNVWLFQQLAPPPPAPTQPEWTGTTKFGLNSFLSQIGVGTGFGLRFDFSFLLLRLDVGIKAWDPARQEGDRFVLDNLRFYKPYSKEREPVIYNIGIGYPF
jgi:outer membrane protein insertion porin family